MSYNSDDHQKKWCCNRCTFHNYPKSKKCVMCSNIRQSLHLIIDDKDSNQNSSQDIYKVFINKTNINFKFNSN